MLGLFGKGKTRKNKLQTCTVHVLLRRDGSAQK